MDLPADFSCDPSLKGRLGYTHRRTLDGMELYFVANKVDAVVQGTCAFRAATGRPECWWPQSGRIEPLAAYQRQGAVTRVPLRLEPHESVFVVFRPGQQEFDPIISLTREGQGLFSPLSVATNIAVRKAAYGVPGDRARTRDVTAKVRTIVAGGERRFAAWRLGQGDDPALQWLKTLSVEYTLDGSPRKTMALDGETVSLDDVPDPRPAARIQRTPDGKVLLEAWQNGQYEFKTAAGRTLRCKVDGIPAPQTIEGPWEVRFPLSAGPPQPVELDKLTSWSRHGDPDVRYFSGTATYSTTFRIQPEALVAGRAMYLDLGKVAVIAELKLNGKDLGILWKAPFRVEAGHAFRAGENRLEVRVTNLWVNRMIGDEQLPEDSDRTPDGQLKAWPPWVLQGKPSPAGRHTFGTYRMWKKDSPLQESGLLGPVEVLTAKVKIVN